MCPNGIINVGEQCDDGNSILNDGCSNCRIDLGWNCNFEPSVCWRFAFCGDGVLTGNEQCDDGGRFSNDGCDENCQI